MFKTRKLPFDLQLFAEGGDGGSGAGDAAGAGAADAGQQSKGVKGNPLANVVYGKQAAAIEAPAAAETTEEKQETEQERSARFDALIRGEFKDLYGKKLQDTLRARMNATEEKVKSYDEMAPMRELLGKRYGVDPGNEQGLIAAVEADNSFYEDEAQELGMSAEQLREMRKTQRENEALHAQIQEAADQERANQIYAGWMQQAEQTKTVYPGFDLQSELSNPLFETLISHNVPVQTAYEVIHKDEIIPAAMEYTARQVEQKLTNKIAAGAARPREGAMGGQGAIQTKSDVSKFTKADRAEILRRALHGERIEL